jgi:hypothetical protein
VTGEAAVAEYENQRWVLADGESLTIGRQSTRDIRIGGVDPGPQDLGVSRHAATISYTQGRLWVRNESTHLPLLVRPALGQEFVLERRGDIVSLADPATTVVLEGQIRTYQVTIRIPDAAPDDKGFGPPTLAPATQAALSVNPRERRLLAALCEPLLRSSGPNARPATYREIASRLALSEHTVRNALDALRERLLMIGIPGMIGPEAKDNLARYAVRSGSITPEDLELLN